MKIKTALKTFVAGSALLALTGTAAAENIYINMYGASAQYAYWQDASAAYLTARGCTNIQRSKTSDNKHGITMATCGDNTVYIRYSSKSSYDGILALEGNNGSAYATAQCTSGYERLMLDPSVCTFTSSDQTPGNCGTSPTQCVPVTLAASDVAGSSFQQKSSGNIKGPAGGGTYTLAQRTFTGVNTTSPVALSAQNPLIVPFGFFVNKGVQKQSAYPEGTWGSIDNITRLMAVHIFSGKVSSWKDFGADYRVWNGSAEVTGNPINVCMRHAGSGTHATLDFAVVRGNGWGDSLSFMQSANRYFNDGSSDMMNCINGGDWSGSGGVNWPAYGAIGYADADQANLTNTVGPVKYQGETPSRASIRNGRYDFWTTQFLYYNPNDSVYLANKDLIDGLETFAGNPTNLTNLIPSKANIWATKAEMKVKKTTDSTFPARTTATSPQLP